MKKITAILMFLIPVYAFGQNTDLPKVQSIITIYRSNNYTEAWGRIEDSGFITGVLYSDYDRQFIGNEYKLNENFLENVPDNYKGKKSVQSGNGFDNEHISDKTNIADKILQYSFYPLGISAKDSVLTFYCKYVIYEKKESPEKYKFYYEVSYHENIYSAPLKKDTVFDFLKNTFPEADGIKIVFDLDRNIHDYPAFDLSALEMNINDIKESVRNSAKPLEMRISAEYIRSDKKGKEVLVRANFECPGEMNYIYEGFIPFGRFAMKIYEGEIEVPFEMYNPKKKALFAKTHRYKDNRAKYEIIIVPLDKKNNIISCQVLICRSMLDGAECYIKKVDLKTGEPIRIELDEADGIYSDETINGQNLNIDVKKDFSAYVNEYIILIAQI